MFWSTECLNLQQKTERCPQSKMAQTNLRINDHRAHALSFPCARNKLRRSGKAVDCRRHPSGQSARRWGCSEDSPLIPITAALQTRRGAV